MVKYRAASVSLRGALDLNCLFASLFLVWGVGGLFLTLVGIKEKLHLRTLPHIWKQAHQNTLMKRRGGLSSVMPSYD